MALKSFRLTKQDQEAQTSVYKDIEYMVDRRNQTYPHFNSEDGDRTLTKYINDSDRRLNGYTLPRENQDKEDWQSNLFNPMTRNKMKALIAGVALQVPEQSFRAVNKKGVFSAQRAELMKQLVRHSRIQGNPQLDIFFEAWESAGKGTVVKFDGYLKTKYKRKFIKSYDLATGEISFDEKEATVDDRPIDLLVPLPEFFIWDFFIFNVQDQPKVAWVQHYNRETLTQEFGKYKNFKFVQDKGTIKRFDSTEEAYFLQKWENRVKEKDDYEVIRYFNKFEDRYEIWVNGVPLLRAPLLWGKAQKMYPFSKTIFEPFVGQSFFYGKSFPSIIEGIQDVDNTLLNTILDKLYRSLTPPMLVGITNKDLFDVESELVNQDNKIYVPDINQVKPMPFESVNQGEISMLEYVARLGDFASVDKAQQGLQGKGVTAREIMIADENAQRLKGIFYMFLEDLWLQKTRLRVTNILMNYMQPQIEKIVGEEGAGQLKDALSVFNIPDVEFSDGSIGVLGVQVAKTKNGMLSVPEIAAREDVMKKNGLNYKMIAVTSSYLDDWEYDFEITTASLMNTDRVRALAEQNEKLQTLSAYFPEYVTANKDKLFEDTIEHFGETIDEYEKPQEAPPPEETVDPNSPLAQGESLLSPLQNEGTPQ